MFIGLIILTVFKIRGGQGGACVYIASITQKTERLEQEGLQYIKSAIEIVAFAQAEGIRKVRKH